MILILNLGSQTIKWKLFDKNLGLIKQGKVNIKNPKKYKDFLVSELKKIQKTNKTIKLIGHRVVHGGPKLRKPIKITPKALKEIKKYNELAPLHNPFNVLGIETCKKVFSKAKQFAVFDTGFFKDLPEKSKICSLPENLRKKYFIRKYGFHGISHEYVSKQAAQKIKKPFNKLKIITCHLGGGASITAIKNGKAIDTSMGFTPLQGLVMMTRTGDIDPGIILYLSKKIGAKKLHEILNKKSGIKAICGLSDMRNVLKAVEKKNPPSLKLRRASKKAKLALDIFVYSIQKYIGSYFAILNGCDILVFTGAIGYGSKKIRNMICKNMSILKNTKILAIETNEELAIAQKIKNL